MNIVFVCHGNICRSPVAEILYKQLGGKHNCFSCALSYEEIGNGIYPPMLKELNKENIQITPHFSNILSKTLINNADYIFYMDDENKYLLNTRFNVYEKAHLISEFTANINEIEDPWYTGNYQKVLNQIKTCVIDIIKNIG